MEQVYSILQTRTKDVPDERMMTLERSLAILVQQGKVSPLEAENYKAGNVMDWEDVIFHSGIRQDYNVSLSGKKEDFNYYWSMGYMDNEALAKGDEFSTIQSRVNLEGRAAKFLKVGLNAAFSYRDESSVSADEGEYRGLSPFDPSTGEASSAMEIGGPTRTRIRDQGIMRPVPFRFRL